MVEGFAAREALRVALNRYLDLVDRDMRGDPLDPDDVGAEYYRLQQAWSMCPTAEAVYRAVKQERVTS